MVYKDIFEFQEMHKTKEEKISAFSVMSEEEVKKLINTCGTPQGKAEYMKLYKTSQVVE